MVCKACLKKRLTEIKNQSVQVTPEIIKRSPIVEILISEIAFIDHSLNKENLEVIKAIIKKDGFPVGDWGEVILIRKFKEEDRKAFQISCLYYFIDGGHRLTAAKELGYDKVPVQIIP